MAVEKWVKQTSNMAQEPCVYAFLLLHIPTPLESPTYLLLTHPAQSFTWIYKSQLHVSVTLIYKFAFNPWKFPFYYSFLSL